ncbi:hypothetical protein NG798_14565 [Ancylothrix sp. C2]|uniref:hypothetical protein n=1 Tax=Ancylothrix sp. D3o TaxID=2953691 RepID=UPI0021BB37A2|nr:hypothetical protein [Ancylothrix sp. D3o]MCT7951019.1 hypothetical protein [Ancylothrix sp. D3o]
MQKLKKNPHPLPRNILWLERLMALLAVTNLGLILFDLSYVPWRDFYLRSFWTLSTIAEPLKKTDFFQLYDPYKGIEPHRDTQKYLETVEKLKSEVAENGLQTPQAATILQELRQQSITIIDENPFQIANKTGSLEKIKNVMRRRIFGTKDASSKSSFQMFWSQEYLTQNGWRNEITFFESQIEPIIKSNYYRQMGENGEFIDRFWKIDRWFIGIFLIELLFRTWWISRRNPNLKWFPDAFLLRWYDLFLILPFWRELRVIPVVIRLNQAKLPDLEPLRNEISRLFLGSVAEEITEVVVIQVINQIQAGIESGELARSVLKSTNKRYIDINNTNEIEEIFKRLLQVTLCKALPQIRPDLEELIRHNIGNAVNQLPVSQQIQRLPGLAGLPDQLTETLATELAKIFTEAPQSAYNSITTAPPDPIAIKLSDRLVEHFSQALRTELQQQNTLTELQNLASDLLEEIKINYVQRTPAETDNEKLLAQTQQLRRLASR